jgi:predicted nucleotidyltransferase
MMRLTAEQQSAIRSTVAETFGDAASVWLFGSRVDDSARGGDMDLLITVKQAPDNSAFTASLIAAKIERAQGGRKVDVVLRTADSPLQPIHEIALRTGVAL